MAEYRIVFFAPSKASGLPDDVIYLNPPQTKNPAATAPAKVTITWIIFLIKLWTLATSADWANTGEAVRRAEVAPEQAVFFSHDQKEVDGALAVGMQAHLAKNLAEVLTKLKTP